MASQLSYWVLNVVDLEKAVAFYGDVFDWTFSEPGSAGGYHVLGSDPMGGIGPRGESGARSPNLLAFQPDDVDAAIERIRALGGTAEEPGGDASAHGRWIECTDDQGTPFALYTPAI